MMDLLITLQFFVILLLTLYLKLTFSPKAVNFKMYLIFSTFLILSTGLFKAIKIEKYSQKITNFIL